MCQCGHFLSNTAVVELAINAPRSGYVLVISDDVDLGLHAPPARCAASARLSGGENSKLNINRTGAVTFPLQLHHHTELKEADKYKTTKGYHHEA